MEFVVVDGVSCVVYILVGEDAHSGEEDERNLESTE